MRHLAVALAHPAQSTMRRDFLPVVVGLLAGLCVFAAASDSKAANPSSIAIFPTLFVTESAQTVISENRLYVGQLVLGLEETLRASRRFKLFERSPEILKVSVLKEQDFSQSSRAAADAAQFGKMNNVEFVLLPIVTRLQLRNVRAPIDELPGKYNLDASLELDLSVKILDSTSGEIKYQISQRDQSSTAARQVDTQSSADIQKLWIDSSFSVGRKIVHKIMDSIFPIQVAAVNGSSISINRGEDEGVAVGDHYDLLSVGETLKDPKTGVVLGAVETPLGEVTVKRVASRLSVVEPSGQLSGSPKVGDILRSRHSEQ